MVVYTGVYLRASFKMRSPATIIIFWLDGSKVNSLHNEVSCQIGLLIFSELHVLCPSFVKSQVPQSVQRAVVLIVQNWLLIQDHWHCELLFDLSHRRPAYRVYSVGTCKLLYLLVLLTLF